MIQLLDDMEVMRQFDYMVFWEEEHTEWIEMREQLLAQVMGWA